MKSILTIYKDIEKPLKYAIIIGLFIIAYLKLPDVKLVFLPVKWSLATVCALLFVFLLTVVNWFLEAKKWQLLTSNTLWQATDTVLNGLVANLFIPAGVGDISYRTLSDKQYHHNFLRALTNAFAQFFPTLLFGIAGIILLKDILSISQEKLYVVLLGVIAGLVVFLSYRKKHFIISGYAFMRYLVFMTQVYLLFYLFNVQSIPVIDWWKYIAVFFLLRTVLPSFLLAELGIRASLTILIFGKFQYDLGNIMLVFALLLIVNNYLPAIIYKIFGLSWLQKLSFS